MTRFALVEMGIRIVVQSVAFLAKILLLQAASSVLGRVRRPSGAADH
jgi:hypothetical protein